MPPNTHTSPMAHMAAICHLCSAMAMSRCTQSFPNQQAVATCNGRKSDHHPWAKSRHLAGMVSVVDRFCPFHPLIRFCSRSELMQTTCIFANFSILYHSLHNSIQVIARLRYSSRCQNQGPCHQRRQRWKRFRLKPWASGRL